METAKGTLEDWRLLQLDRAKRKAKEYNDWQDGIEKTIRRIDVIRNMMKKKNPNIKFEQYGRKYNDLEDLKERKCIS